MVDIPTPKQRRIIKSKIKGTSNKDIGAIEYPNATPRSQEVLVSRELKKGHVAQYYEQSKLQALKEHNITWSRIIAPLSDALEAGTKWQTTDEETGEVTTHETIDHATRLRASKQAQDLLRIKDEVDPDAAPLNTLPAGIDEIQLVRLLRGK